MRHVNPKDLIVASPVIDLLSQARARVAKGWGRGAFCLNERYCAMGAVIHDGLSPDAVKALHLLAQAAGSFDPGSTWIIHWNDNPNRTQAEVLAAFDRAIIMATEESLK